MSAPMGPTFQGFFDMHGNASMDNDNGPNQTTYLPLGETVSINTEVVMELLPR